MVRSSHHRPLLIKATIVPPKGDTVGETVKGTPNEAYGDMGLCGRCVAKRAGKRW
jgi:hypothetical protein